MSAYLLSVVGTVILCSVLTAILPEGKTAGLIKAIVRIACVLAIVAPVLTFFQKGTLSVNSDKKSQSIFSQSVIDGERAFIKYYSEMRVSQAEDGLEKELLKTYAVQATVAIEWELQSQEIAEKYNVDLIKITQIRVDTGGKAEKGVIENMSEYLTKNYCSEVLIE